MTTIEHALRRLDIADPAADATSLRAQADLDRILRTAPDQVPAAPRQPGRRTTTRLVVGAASVAAAAGAVFVAVPAVTGGDAAYATWTPTPTGLSAADAAKAADQCREQQIDGGGADYATELRAASPAVAERRGDWTTVILASTEGYGAMCVTDDSAHLFRNMFGSVWTPDAAVQAGPREINISDLGWGTTGAGDLSLAAGVAGADVKGVSFHSAAKGEVVATVSGGHFALWFPGKELANASRDGIVLTLTYADGQTAQVRAWLGRATQAPAEAGARANPVP